LNNIQSDSFKKVTVLDIDTNVMDSQGATSVDTSNDLCRVQFDFIDKLGCSIKHLHATDGLMNALFVPIQHDERSSSSHVYTFHLNLPKPGKDCQQMDFQIVVCVCRLIRFHWIDKFH